MIIRLIKLFWRTAFDIVIVIAGALRRLGAPGRDTKRENVQPDTELWPYDLVIDKNVYNDILAKNGNVTLEWDKDYIVGVVIGYNGKYLDRVKVAFLNGREMSHPIIKIYHVRELMKIDSPVRFLTSMAHVQQLQDSVQNRFILAQPLDDPNWEGDTEVDEFSLDDIDDDDDGNDGSGGNNGPLLH